MSAPYSTGIGSLPFDDPEVAVAHVFAHYSLPFLPQLPRCLAVGDMAAMLAEALTPELLMALKNKDRQHFASTLTQVATNADQAKALIARWPGATASFKRAAAKAPRLKMQLIGPASFITLCDMHLGAGAVPIEATCTWLSLLQKTALEQLAKACEEIVWLWDDALLALPAHAITRALWFQRSPPPQVREGFHCCAPIPLATLVDKLPVQLLAIDLNVVTTSPQDVQALAQRGGQLIAGIVDTRLTKVDQIGAFRLLAELPRSAVLAVSGGCGTGLHAVGFEKEVAALLSSMRRDD